MNWSSNAKYVRHCKRPFLPDRTLIIAANRGPITFQSAEAGSRTFTRGSGGLVTALLGLARHVDTTWIACARTDADVDWEEGEVAMGTGSDTVHIRFLSPTPEAYDGYYNVIANPLLVVSASQHVGYPPQTGDRSGDVASMGRGICRRQPVICRCDHRANPASAIVAQW